VKLEESDESFRDDWGRMRPGQRFNVPLYCSDICKKFNISTDVAVNYVSLYLTKAEEMAMARTDMDNFQVHKYDVQARVEERREKLFRLGVAVEDKRSASDGGEEDEGKALALRTAKKANLDDPAARVRDLHATMHEKGELVKALQRRTVQRESEIAEAQREAHQLIIMLQRANGKNGTNGDSEGSNGHANGNGFSNGHENGHGNGLAAASVGFQLTE